MSGSNITDADLWKLFANCSKPLCQYEKGELEGIKHIVSNVFPQPGYHQDPDPHKLHRELTDYLLRLLWIRESQFGRPEPLDNLGIYFTPVYFPLK